jgi:hypothetical protein
MLLHLEYHMPLTLLTFIPMHLSFLVAIPIPFAKIMNAFFLPVPSGFAHLEEDRI